MGFDKLESDVILILKNVAYWPTVYITGHKTNPDLSYFELSYVFWEHNDSVGRGTTVIELI